MHSLQAARRWAAGFALAASVLTAGCGPKSESQPLKANGATAATASPATGASPGTAASPGTSASPGAAASGAGGASSAPKATGGPGPGGSGARPGGPVSVTVTTAQRRDLPALIEATGTIAPRRSVEVRPQVAGLLREVLVREGDSVRAGQVLFRLDDRNERAQLERARAQLLRDEASLADAQRQLGRSQDLLRQNFISQGAVDAASTAVQTLAAGVAASRAAVQAADVSLSLMTISAPQPGRLGAITVHPGATVGPAALALVTISELQPVTVNFAVPQRNLADALRLLKAKAKAVEVAAADGSDPQPVLAALSFVDSTVDAASGTVRLKAELENPDNRWWPGTYVRVRLRLQTLEKATVVPTAAIVQAARGRSVFIVDEQGLAQAKPVEVLAMSDGLAAVQGLEPGTKVVLEGRHNLRPGTPVVERKANAGGAQP